MAQSSPSTWELVTLGSTLLGCIVGGLVIGLLIDHYAGSTPIGALTGVAVGLVSAGFAMYGRMRRFLG